MVLEYRLDVRHPGSREIRVSLEFTPAKTLPPGHHEDGTVDLFLPTWTPGSYLIREFARNLGRVEAHGVEQAAPLRCEKISKNRFRIHLDSGTRRIRVAWTVHAHELSVRTADLTSEHGYWNHACLLLWPVGGLALPARVTVAFPSAWELACAMPADPTSIVDGVDRQVTLLARDFDHAMDSPCLVGRFQRFELLAAGAKHTVVLDGLGPIAVPPRLLADLGSIIEQAAAVFGGGVPYSNYLFVCLFTADGHGGLEHADSTTLLMGRTAFATEQGYREFLSLAAHELFHAWNVKRLRPAEFWRYDYEVENYTEFLWLIEGWTAYYDDLLCVRAGVFTRQHYLEAAAKNINGMLAAPGRFRLSLRESSFDAWIRLYRPDANTRNSSQNYYVNGAVAAMCLDLSIRRTTQGTRSLDDVLKSLYRTTFESARGYELEDVHRALRDVAGDSAITNLEGLVAGRFEPDLTGILASFGVRTRTRETDRAYLGVHFENGSMIVASVTNGSPAFEAGLHPGDEIIAVENLRVESARWSDAWQTIAKAGRKVSILLSRRGIVATIEVVPVPSPGTVTLELAEAADAGAAQLLAGWLPEAARTSGAVTCIQVT